MHGKALWQWLKPMLLIFPVIAVTATTLIDLRAGAPQAARVATFSRVRVAPVVEETNVAPGNISQTVVPVRTEAERSTEALGIQVREGMAEAALSWAELLGDDASTPGGVTVGDSFQHPVMVQAVVVPVAEPAGDTTQIIGTNTTNPPAPTTTGNNNPSPQTTTGGDDHGGGNSNSGSGSGNSGSGSGNSGSGGSGNSGSGGSNSGSGNAGSGNSGSGSGNSGSGHGGDG